MKIQHQIAKAQAGQRVDLILSKLCPHLSLRELRRNWDALQARLNGRPVAKGAFAGEGDQLEADLSFVFAPQEMATNSAPNAKPAVQANAKPDADPNANPDVTPDLEPDFMPDSGPETGPGMEPELALSVVKVLQRKNGVLALYKPAGLHSACLSGGRGGLSLEALLPSVLAVSGKDFGQGCGQDCEQSFEQDCSHAPAELFNRLDCLTTGLVLATENETAKTRCLRFEESGQIEKRYFALVHGILPGEITMRQALDTDSRRTTRVLNKDDPSPLRHTVARPLLYFVSLSEFLSDGQAELGEQKISFDPDLKRSAAPNPAGRRTSAHSEVTPFFDLPDLPGTQNPLQAKSGFSLLEVVIYMGARHQIRAHLSFAGYPIVGDPLYGSTRPNRSDGPEGPGASFGPWQADSGQNLAAPRLYLHHFGLTMPGFVALCKAPWGKKACNLLAGFYPAFQNEL